MASRTKAKVTRPELEKARPLVRSIVKKDVTQLTRYVAGLNSVLKDPGVVAIRICECCINVSMPNPGDKEKVVNILIR